MKSATEIFAELNNLDETPHLEAKSCSGGVLGDSFFETVCAFCNEPNHGGGYLLLGVAKGEDALSSGYAVCGVSDPDKIQQDIASGCATRFNRPIRPQIRIEALNQTQVIVIFIEELAAQAKPLFFAKNGLPRGAWRRIGATDQRCTEEDMGVFFGNQQRETYDERILHHCTIEDLDPVAIAEYRKLRGQANESAEELRWNHEDLLSALKAVRREDGIWRPTLTGLLIFGSQVALRRELPMVRVDYIRVAGNEWVHDPDRRFEKTIEMRGPLLQIVDRVLAAVMDDLPKGFELDEGQVQAKTPTLPSRVLREAIVNALMHRSYREHQPTQVIRYGNRIEIKNAGFSLKNEDTLEETGSQLRNPTLAAIFHETNTAETKGSGIRTMRKLMQENGFSPPTFESNRAHNFFVSRLLLHHFLNETDLLWLNTVDRPLSDHQRIALIFVREQGAIDNQTLRQLTSADVSTASSELRKLRQLKLLDQRGRSSATYYQPGPLFPPPSQAASANAPRREVAATEDGSKHSGHGTLADEHGTLADEHGTLGDQHGTLADQHGTLGDQHGTLGEDLPERIQKKLASLGSRPGKEKLRPIILEICAIKGPLTADQLAQLLGNRNPRALKADHLREMIADQKLAYLYPDMEKHPHQAYTTVEPKSAT